MKATPEQLFESQLLAVLCSKLVEIGEMREDSEFQSYPKDNLADIHNNVTGAYFLMTGENPVKLVEYNLLTLEVIPV